MKFHTQRERPKKILEKNNDKRITETAGYIPANVRIANIMLAGANLKQYRAEQYDFGDGQVDPEFFDPTRCKNFDLADAGILQNATNEALEAQYIASKQRSKEKAKEKEAEYKKLKEEAEKASKKPLEEDKKD